MNLFETGYKSVYTNANPFIMFVEYITACDFDSGLIKKYDVFYKNIQNVTAQEHIITYSDKFQQNNIIPILYQFKTYSSKC